MFCLWFLVFRLLLLINNEQHLINREFLATNTIDLNFLSMVSLKEDVNVLCKLFNKTNVELNINVLNKINEKCPRIIGVLLSNNILIECTNGKK